jgi:hypothetical protein
VIRMSEGVPAVELRILTALCVAAVDLALDGFASDGYVSLVTGLCRARSQAGEAWTEELVAQYQRTLDDYADRYQVARD